MMNCGRLSKPCVNFIAPRNAGIIYDDAYGVWTEADQASAAAEAFAMFDRQGDRHDSAETR
jgi:hypothetical protein